MSKEEKHEEPIPGKRQIDGQGRSLQKNEIRKSKSKSGKGIFLALLCSFLGSIKGLVVSEINSLGAIEIFGLRCLGSSSFIFPFVIYKNYQVFYDWKMNCKLLFRSIVGNIAVGGCYFGFRNLPLGDASIIFYSTSIYTCLFGCLCLKERCGWKEVLSVTIALAGVTLVTSPTLILNSNGTFTSESFNHNSTNALRGELTTDSFMSMNSSWEMVLVPQHQKDSLISTVSTDPLWRNDSQETSTGVMNRLSVSSGHASSTMCITGSTKRVSRNVTAGIAGALLGAIAQALALILLRELHVIPAPVISFWWSVVGAISSFLVACFTADFTAPMRRTEGLYIILVAAVGFSSELCLVVALFFEEAGKVSLILTSEIIWALILQILFQNEKLTIFRVTGAVAITAAIILPSINHRNFKKFTSVKVFRSKNSCD